ncbi:excinuclease ABC subunit UvrC [Corynebacterium choanae]|uniref:UvrABC system protein C n=1 Tax=Corynebacterium choanae TaxID=1862358 RepID=A0A3G6J792_9CORY|nr:excinuclease ABC subunit UvrC [Corynebacterium choanae]AZA13643.1 UvrABC system protein C [Corynebacterium choanae]
MADPSTYRPAPGSIPTDPGVYKFRDAEQRVIYVGKAKSLRQRLNSYFADLSQLHPRTRQMVTAASSVEWTVVGSEVEALQLEYTWIKKFDPRFNVKYRDDKSYPYLAVSVGEQFPRAFVYRGPRKRTIRYFGPYSHAWAIRETLDLLTRVFPMRTCSKGVFQRHQTLGRPCLLGYIDKCCAPCVDRVSAAEHREIVDGFVRFMAGRTDQVVATLTQQMQAASEELDFEKAARLRDDLGAIEKVMERQAVVFGDGTDADVLAAYIDELEVSLQLFHVRQGRIRGQRGWVVERSGQRGNAALGDGTGLPDNQGDNEHKGRNTDSADDAVSTDAVPADVAELVQHFLVQFYTDAVEATGEVDTAITRRGVDRDEHRDLSEVSPVPKEVLLNVAPADVEQTAAYLSRLRGSTVAVRIPQRGEKAALLETVEKNAAEALRRHKTKRVGDLTARSEALNDIAAALGMSQAPLRIECTDISHISGHDVVASLVVFEDGLPKKSDYRRYKIRYAAGDGHSNDVASIAEVTARRFQRHPTATTAGDQPTVVEESTDGKRFAYPPQLFIVDGGKPQVNAAAEVFAELGITDVTLVGLAKRLEELWLPDDDEPVIIPRGSSALYMLQQIRDEAHRFAVTYHRQQRSKRLRVSALDDIPGVGPTRKAQLMRTFGSVKRLREAAVEDIAAIPGFGAKRAAQLFAALHPQDGASSAVEEAGKQALARNVDSAAEP